jgi:putative cardiolipin synthase
MIADRPDLVKPTIHLFSIILCLILTGCASVPKDYPRESSEAFRDPQQTAIGSHIARASEEHEDQSGFALLRHGRQAFTARIALTELAEKTLDVQYYIWEDDATGHTFSQRLLKAADRGIRVRVLLDDINLKGRDENIASLSAHPNVEIRLFNPFAHRSARALDFIADFGRVNHRMHNKLIVMDNALALVDSPHTKEDLARARTALADKISADNYPHPLDQDVEALSTEIIDIIDKLVWGAGQIIWDDPKTIQETGSTSRMQEALHRRTQRLEKELLIESAYFVVRDRGVNSIRELNERGVRVRILTNSLISNDVLAAHAGYAERRRELVEYGAELHELRPDAGTIKQRVVSGESKGALQTKAIVFHRQDVFYRQLQPRSALRGHQYRSWPLRGESLAGAAAYGLHG